MGRIPTQERSQYKVLQRQGWSTRAIARHYHRARQSVQRWLDRTENDPSDTAIIDRKRPGRKRKTTAKQDDLVAKRYRQTWRKKDYSRRNIGRELRNKPIAGVPQISGDTVYRRLKEKAGPIIVVPRKFVLTPTHRKLRRKWASKIKNDNFKKWLFSDETLFKVGCRKHRAFRFPGEKFEDIKFQYPIRQNVWACMSATGVGEMAFIDGNLTGEKYKAILQDKLQKAATKLFPDGHWKFQQDNDPKHTAGVVTRWLEEERIEVVDWPSSSPDMNVQENLHKIWKDRVDALRPVSKQDLRSKITRVFNEMSEEDTLPLVESMERRVHALEKAKGGHTKY